jgi:hypothetical protein
MAIKPIALTAHPVVVFSSSLPTEIVEIKGRPTMVVSAGVNPLDYQLGIIPASGLPVPQVGNIDATSTEMEIEGLVAPVSISLSSGKQITGLPAAEEGVIYISSSFTASSAAATGRTDVYAPAQIVCHLNEDGTTTILGTIGLKQGG